MARHIMVLFEFATEAPYLEDQQPGGLGQFVVFPRGHGTTRLDGRTVNIDTAGHMMSGFSVAAPFKIHGPWHAIGASLSPLGWAALTGVPACDYIDRFPPVGELMGEEATAFCDDLSARYRDGALSGEAACRELGEWLGRRLRPIPSRHEQLIKVTLGWMGSSLSPDIDELFPRLDYSRRQAERLVERYFGLPPAALVRKYRALRSAALLAKEKLSDSDEAALAEAFCDQPHMINEIRRFCGYTPTRLGGEGQPIMKTLLQMRNYSRLHGVRGDWPPTP